MNVPDASFLKSGDSKLNRLIVPNNLPNQEVRILPTSSELSTLVFNFFSINLKRIPIKNNSLQHLPVLITYPVSKASLTRDAYYRHKVLEGKPFIKTIYSAAQFGLSLYTRTTVDWSLLGNFATRQIRISCVLPPNLSITAFYCALPFSRT